MGAQQPKRDVLLYFKGDVGTTRLKQYSRGIRQKLYTLAKEQVSVMAESICSSVCREGQATLSKGNISGGSSGFAAHGAPEHVAERMMHERGGRRSQGEGEAGGGGRPGQAGGPVGIASRSCRLPSGSWRLPTPATRIAQSQTSNTKRPYQLRTCRTGGPSTTS